MTGGKTFERVGVDGKHVSLWMFSRHDGQPTACFLLRLLLSLVPDSEVMLEVRGRGRRGDAARLTSKKATAGSISMNHPAVSSCRGWGAASRRAKTHVEISHIPTSAPGCASNIPDGVSKRKSPSITSPKKALEITPVAQTAPFSSSALDRVRSQPCPSPSISSAPRARAGGGPGRGAGGLSVVLRAPL